MTTPDTAKAAEIVEKLRSSAKAFRDHPIYDQDGDGVYLTVQAQECEQAADLIEALSQRPTDTARAGEAELRVAIQRGLIAELGDTYDCTRVWAAWGVGTMDQDDFTPVLDRLDEIIDTITYEIDAIPVGADEQAFRAGFAAAEQALGAHGSDSLLAAIESAWTEYRLDHPATPSPVTDETALSGEALGIATIEMVETVQAWPPGEPADPFWRIKLGGYCADFCHEQAARNFASAINAALASTPQPAVAEGRPKLSVFHGEPDFWSGAHGTRPNSAPVYGKAKGKNGEYLDIGDEIIAHGCFGVTPRRAVIVGIGDEGLPGQHTIKIREHKSAYISAAGAIQCEVHAFDQYLWLDAETKAAAELSAKGIDLARAVFGGFYFEAFQRSAMKHYLAAIRQGQNKEGR